jgi:predicted MFS family arabinose efflux permease
VEADEIGEGDRENPIKAISIVIRNRNVLLAVAMAFCFLFAEFGIDTFLTVYLTNEVGIPLAAAVVVSGASGLTGWVGQIVWGTLSDGLGRKFSLGIIAVGWTVAVLAIIFISDLLTAWIILLGWGIFRNSPFPVLYAFLIGS